MVNYRDKYGEYYDIEIPQGLDIHHIDGNRENNDISNLIAMPHNVHMRYHAVKNELERMNGLTLSLDPQKRAWFDYQNGLLAEWLRCIEDMREALSYKLMLDYAKDNKGR